MSSPNAMDVDLFRHGVVTKSRGAIKVVIGTLVGVALAPVMLELAAIGAVIQVTGMVEIISGSMDVIESANCRLPESPKTKPGLSPDLSQLSG